jgi:hypothetical protein
MFGRYVAWDCVITARRSPVLSSASTTQAILRNIRVPFLIAIKRAAKKLE